MVSQGNSRNNIPVQKVFLLMFIFVVIIIFIQTYANIDREKNLRLYKVIDEKEKLTRLAASSIETTYYQVTPLHKKEVLNSLRNLSDTEFCRIVTKNGLVYMSTVENEVGKKINHPVVATDSVVTVNDIWQGRNIKVVVAPAHNDYTLWLGYNVDKVVYQVKDIVFEHIKIAFIMLLVLLVYIIYTSERVGKTTVGFLAANGDSLQEETVTDEYSDHSSCTTRLVTLFNDIDKVHKEIEVLGGRISHSSLQRKLLREKIWWMTEGIKKETGMLSELKNTIGKMSADIEGIEEKAGQLDKLGCTLRNLHIKNGQIHREEIYDSTGAVTSGLCNCGRNIEQVTSKIFMVTKEMRGRLDWLSQTMQNTINTLGEYPEKLSAGTDVLIHKTENMVVSIQDRLQQVSILTNAVKEKKEQMTDVMRSISNVYGKAVFVEDSDSINIDQLRGVEELYNQLRMLNYISTELKESLDIIDKQISLEVPDNG